MIVLALDQARNCGFALFDSDTKAIVSYGCFSYPSPKYTFAQAVMHLESVVEKLIDSRGVEAVCLEGIQLRANPRSFAALAQLQGVLINVCEKRQMPYAVVQPSSWQNYCGARGRSTKEIKQKLEQIVVDEDVKLKGKKASKVLSIQFVKDKYGIETYNDNVADAVCIGTYIVNNIEKLGNVQEK